MPFSSWQVIIQQSFMLNTQLPEISLDACVPMTGIGPGLQDTRGDVGRTWSKHVAERNHQRFQEALWWRHGDGRHVSSCVTRAAKPQRAVETGRVKPRLSTPLCLTSEGLKVTSLSQHFPLLSTLAAFWARVPWCFPTFTDKEVKMSSNVKYWLQTLQD